MSIPSGIDRPEPAFAADEATTLRGFLDYFRATIRRQVEGLDADQLRLRLPVSSMTLGGIVEHLAWVEDWWFGQVFVGRAQAARWSHLDWEADGDAEWADAVHRDLGTLDELLRDSVSDSDRVLEEALVHGGLDQISARDQHGDRASLRWILVHLIEEYARHCGHADLIRESIDGATDL